jgi:hypothetical protein
VHGRARRAERIATVSSLAVDDRSAELAVGRLFFVEDASEVARFGIAERVAPPDPDGPNMSRCAVPGYVSALYEGAGLRDIAEWDVDVELVTRSPAQYWEMISEHVSLAVAALQQVDEPARERIRANAIAKVSAFEKDGKFRVPGVARCIVGTK